MISIKKADFTKKKEYSKEMKLDGFISICRIKWNALYSN